MSKGILLFFILAGVSEGLLYKTPNCLKYSVPVGNKTGKTALFF